MSTRQGCIAEQRFQLACMERDIPIFKPLLDNYGMDYILQCGGRLTSVQVKSVLKSDPKRGGYKVTVGKGHDCRVYELGDFDFLVVYIFELDLFYIIPAVEVTVRCIRLSTKSGGRFDKYKNKWDLLE